jgi:hypothetical protein
MTVRPIVRRNSLAICPHISDGITRGKKIMSGKKKILSAVAVAAALIATAAVGRTVQTHAVAAGAHATHGSAISPAPGQITLSRRHAIIACPLANEPDCEKLETLLPM